MTIFFTEIENQAGGSVTKPRIISIEDFPPKINIVGEKKNTDLLETPTRSCKFYTYNFFSWHQSAYEKTFFFLVYCSEEIDDSDNDMFSEMEKNSQTAVNTALRVLDQNSELFELFFFHIMKKLSFFHFFFQFVTTIYCPRMKPQKLRRNDKSKVGFF